MVRSCMTLTGLVWKAEWTHRKTQIVKMSSVHHLSLYNICPFVFLSSRNSDPGFPGVWLDGSLAGDRVWFHPVKLNTALEHIRKSASVTMVIYPGEVNLYMVLLEAMCFVTTYDELRCASVLLHPSLLSTISFAVCVCTCAQSTKHKAAQHQNTGVLFWSIVYISGWWCKLDCSVSVKLD